MAALNLAHELPQAQSNTITPKKDISFKLTNLCHKIENVLENS
jgi:cell division protein ZapA (FtsZ GTPase activity inhibitor)